MGNGIWMSTLIISIYIQHFNAGWYIDKGFRSLYRVKNILSKTRVRMYFSIKYLQIVFFFFLLFLCSAKISTASTNPFQNILLRDTEFEKILKLESDWFVVDVVLKLLFWDYFIISLQKSTSRTMSRFLQADETILSLLGSLDARDLKLWLSMRFYTKTRKLSDCLWLHCTSLLSLFRWSHLPSS